MVRLLPFCFADGPHNMAADEVLLESARGGIASLRFYGWSMATVSLGYFQADKLRREDERLTSLPFVRRPTGGGALVHHHELTYALALPAASSWQRRGQSSWLCRMHAIISDSLRELGVNPETIPNEQPAPNLLCFHHLTPGDLVLSRAKIVGSAQRKQRGCLLQHGSILLAASPHAPTLPGILELTGRAISIPDLASALEKSFVAKTGWNLTAADWTAGELEGIEELVRNKYSQPAWNQKR
ncbi:MAG TPA: biotin/lipoate A/B protein ligase family protein [Gemmataceae bacterium]|jgi:lipoate-protein ligase A|nr:biotin/lipoate A/B protein ligase family protein [Gemmataceae bacterium]